MKKKGNSKKIHKQTSKQKILNEKNLLIQVLYPLNIYPSKVNKTFFGKKTEIIHFQQTYPVVNVRGSPVRKKMMPDRESNL